MSARFDLTLLMIFYLLTTRMATHERLHPDPANILLARFGLAVDQETINQFFRCLLQSDTLPGL